MSNKKNYKNPEQIEDAMWKNAESGNKPGEIKFRKNI